MKIIGFFFFFYQQLSFFLSFLECFVMIKNSVVFFVMLRTCCQKAKPCHYLFLNLYRNRLNSQNFNKSGSFLYCQTMGVTEELLYEDVDVDLNVVDEGRYENGGNDADLKCYESLALQQKT